MIGDFAVNMQGFSRAMGDVDLWLKDELQNRKNVRKAFADLGYGDFDSLESMHSLSNLYCFITTLIQWFPTGNDIVHNRYHQQNVDKMTCANFCDYAQYA